MPIRRSQIGGIRFDFMAVQDAEKQIMALIGNTTGASVHLSNSYTYSLARQNPRLRSVLNSSALNLVDGRPLKWLHNLEADHRWHEPDVPIGVTRGPDLFRRTLAGVNELSARHYLLGGNPATLRAINNKLNSVGRARVIGSTAPPYTDDLTELISYASEEIAGKNIDVVWVGLGTPKQDLVCAELAEAYNCVFVAVGAAFDFFAETKPEAPKWLHHSGLEWVYRLTSEPRRLVPRYFSAACAVGATAVRSLIARRSDR